MTEQSILEFAERFAVRWPDEFLHLIRIDNAGDLTFAPDDEPPKRRVPPPPNVIGDLMRETIGHWHCLDFPALFTRCELVPVGGPLTASP